MGKQNRRSVVLEPDAAGIDIGAEEIYVAVPPDDVPLNNSLDAGFQSSARQTTFLDKLRALRAAAASKSKVISTEGSTTELPCLRPFC
jgi:hypothetical protein